MIDARTSDAISRGASARYRIVIVEDSPMIRHRLVEDLSERGQVEIVGVADTEKDAIALIGQLAPDAAIMDLSLREGSGLNVIREVRRRLPEMPVCIIVLTNFPYGELRDRSRASGANFFFDKAHEYECVGELIHRLAARSMN